MIDLHYRASLSFLKLSQRQAEGLESLAAKKVCVQLTLLEADLQAAYFKDDLATMLAISKSIIAICDELIVPNELAH